MQSPTNVTTKNDSKKKNDIKDARSSAWQESSRSHSNERAS
jgi:hypothetical protein